MTTAYIAASAVLFSLCVIDAAIPPIKRSDVITAGLCAAMAAFGWCTLIWH